MNRFESYLELTTKTYDEAVEILLKKYGPATDDYYREKSYERFMKDEIKSIAKGRFSRGSEGLECHHIDEDIYINMSNPSFIKAQQIPFEYHKKERLIFSDIVEHTILHFLIMKKQISYEVALVMKFF